MASRKLEDNVRYQCDQLVDYSPLVSVMTIVAREIREGGGSFDKPRSRKAWIEIMESIQGEWSCSDHNPRLPCRFCKQAFRPRNDEALLTAFLEWETTRETAKLIALHRCPACGGQLAALDTKIYDEDFHTPEPGSIENDDDWAEHLLSNCEE